MVHINYFIRTLKCVCLCVCLCVWMFVYRFIFFVFFYHHHLLQLSFSVSGTPEIRSVCVLVCACVQYSKHFCLLLVVISKTTVVILTTCFMASSSWWFLPSPNWSASANLHHFCSTSWIHDSITHSYNKIYWNKTLDYVKLTLHQENLAEFSSKQIVFAMAEERKNCWKRHKNYKHKNLLNCLSVHKKRRERLRGSMGRQNIQLTSRMSLIYYTYAAQTTVCCRRSRLQA